MTAAGAIDFSRLDLSDDELDALIEDRPGPRSIGGGLPERDAELLRGVLKSVFLSNPDVRLVVRTLVGLLAAHHQSVFSNPGTFIRGIYSPDPWPDDAFPAVCVTGLGGVGKTEIKKAFLRLLGKAFEDMSLRNVDGHTGIPFRPVWHVSLSHGTSLGAILLPMLDAYRQRSACEENSDARFDESFPSPGAIRKQARRQSWRDSTSFIWSDEFQQVSYGSSSNARAAQLLYQLMLVGPRLVYTANFSMVRALMRRPQQDTQRLLSAPICIEPMLPGCESGVALLEAYKVAVPGLFDFEAAEAEPVVHQYSYGINRCKVNLLYHAYLVARREGRDALRVDDLEKAYVSREMASQREEVEELLRGEINRVSIREDLMNPFGYREKEKGAKASNVHELTKAKQGFECRVQEGLLRDSLTPEQVVELERVDGGAKKRMDKPATVTRIRRQKPSKEELMEGIMGFGAGASE